VSKARSSFAPGTEQLFLLQLKASSLAIDGVPRMMRQGGRMETCMAADRSSGKGGGKRGAGGRKKSAAGKAGQRNLPVKSAAAKNANPKAVKSVPSKASSKAAKPVKTSKPAARRGAVANTGTNALQLPPLPPPLPAPPKKLSRSPVRRAVGIRIKPQKTLAAPPNAGDAFSENELREKMRLASAYIDSWLNRRLIFAAEVTAPEDAWAQIWFWLKHEAPLDDGRMLTQELFETLYNDEMTKAR
jgi:hypothetical protein